MKNSKEFEKMLQIVGDMEYVEDKEFVDTVVKKVNFWRNFFYITFIPCLFYLIQNGRIIPDSLDWRIPVMLISFRR